MQYLMAALVFVLAWSVASAAPSAADSPPAAIAELVQRDELPAGVALEIVENDRAALSALLPRIRASIRTLHTRNPDLPIVLVTHGAEQFSLARGAAGQDTLRAEIEALVLEDGVNIAVCGTFAGWRDLDEAAFPDFVDVTPAAPERLDELREAGYSVVRLRPSRLDHPAQDPWEFDFHGR